MATPMDGFKTAAGMLRDGDGEAERSRLPNARRGPPGGNGGRRRQRRGRFRRRAACGPLLGCWAAALSPAMPVQAAAGCLAVD